MGSHPGTMRAGLRRAAHAWPGIALIAVLLGAWQLAVSGGAVSSGIASPAKSLRALANLFDGGAIFPDLLHTLTSALLGWLVGSALAIALAALIASVGLLWRLAITTVEVLRAIPAIALVPVAILVFGFSLNMEIAVSAYVTLWPVLISTALGLRAARAAYRDVGQVLRLSARDRMLKLALPGAARQLIVGLRLGLSSALALAIVAEMIGNPDGLGAALVRAQQSTRSDQVFALVLLIGMLGAALNAAFLLGLRLAGPGIAHLAGEK